MDRKQCIFLHSIAVPEATIEAPQHLHIPQQFVRATNPI
jgi:hypothetical protein